MFYFDRKGVRKNSKVAADKRLKGSAFNQNTRFNYKPASSHTHLTPSNPETPSECCNHGRHYHFQCGTSVSSRRQFCDAHSAHTLTALSILVRYLEDRRILV